MATEEIEIEKEEEIVIDANTKKGKKNQQTINEIKKHIKEATKPELLPAFLSIVAIFLILIDKIFFAYGLFVVSAVFKTIAILLIMPALGISIVNLLKQQIFKLNYTHGLLAFATLIACV